MDELEPPSDEFVQPSDEPEPPTLVGHTCKPAAVPAPGEGVSEAERLRAALTWAYEYDLLARDSSHALTHSVHYESEGSGGPVLQARFELVEDSDGTERTALLRRTGGVVSLEDVELIPLDFDHRGERPFKLLAASAEERRIMYPDEPGWNFWRIRVGGLSMLRSPAAAVYVSVGDSKPVGFPAPVEARASVEDEFRIDRLGPDDGGGPRSLKAHLEDLFGLFCEGEPPRAMDVGCEYAYHVGGGGMEVTVTIPVFLARGLECDPRPLAESVAAAMSEWRESVQPAVGAFVIRLQLRRLEAGAENVWVDFGRLVLPSESVEDFKVYENGGA